MELKQFAQEHRLQVRKDVDGTDIISGKFGHLYEHSATKLGVLFMPPAPRARLWSAVKAKGTAVGMTVRQNGESEGTLLFDPANPEQSGLALKLVRVKTKRVMSEAQSLALAKARAKLSQNLAPEGVLETSMGQGVPE